jgi:hypothetical protein
MRIDDFRSYVDGAKLNIKEGNAPMHLMLNDPYERQDLSGWLPAPMTRADQDAIIEKAYAELDAEKRLILTDADRKILTDLAQTIEHMSRPGLMLDEPEDPHYPPIEVAESDLGAYHLPLLKEILSRDLDRRVMEPEFTAEVSTGTVKALEDRLPEVSGVDEDGTRYDLDDETPQRGF